MDDTKEIRNKLIELRTEHRDIDDSIESITQRGDFDQIQVQRMKKRKLFLKDQISTLENRMLPNIIA